MTGAVASDLAALYGHNLTKNCCRQYQAKAMIENMKGEVVDGYTRAIDEETFIGGRNRE